MKGKKNIYTCKSCGHFVVTIDLDEGTTPFIIKCQNTVDGGKHICNGQMFSAMYNIPHIYQTIPATMEWYKPDPEETKKLKGYIRDHVLKGGLIMRQCQAQAKEKS